MTLDEQIQEYLDECWAEYDRLPEEQHYVFQGFPRTVEEFTEKAKREKLKRAKDFRASIVPTMLRSGALLGDEGSARKLEELQAS